MFITNSVFVISQMWKNTRNSTSAIRLGLENCTECHHVPTPTIRWYYNIVIVSVCANHLQILYYRYIYLYFLVFLC